MSDKFNPASRVATFFEAALREQSGTAALQAWCSVFGIQSQEQREQITLLHRNLALLSGELDLVLEQVNSRVAGAPGRYEGALERARAAITVVDLSPQFQQYKQYISHDQTNLFHIVSDQTPDEERVDQDALDDVMDMVGELRDYAEDHLEGQFRAFVLRQVDIIAEAIGRYPIIGQRAFSDGANATLANLIENREVYEHPPDEEAKGKFKRLVKRFLTLAPERAAQIAQVINAVNSFKELTSGGGGS